MAVVRSSALPFAFLAALLLGCGTAATAQPSPSTPAALPAAPAPTPEIAAGPPLTTEDGSVKVPRPRAEGWECRTEHVDNPRVRASYVQCRRLTPAGALSLMAKDYEVPAESVMSAEELSTREYPNHYRKRWAHVTYTRSSAIDHHGHPGWEVAVDLAQDTGPTTHRVERVVVSGTHTLNLSAEGPAETFGAFEPEAKRWFDGAELAALQGDPRREASLSPGLTGPR